MSIGIVPRVVAVAVATGSFLVPLPPASATSSSPVTPTVVISIDSGVLTALVHSESPTGPLVPATEVVIGVLDFDIDADEEPLPTGTPTGQSCTIVNPDPSSPAAWEGRCTIAGMPSWRWIGVTATPYSGPTPGAPSDSNQVLWAGGNDEPATGASSGMSDVQQALPRSMGDDCTHVVDTGLDWGTGVTGGWRPSWAYWANGPVCVRTLTHGGSGWRLA